MTSTLPPDDAKGLRELFGEYQREQAARAGVSVLGEHLADPLEYYLAVLEDFDPTPGNILEAAAAGAGIAPPPTQRVVIGRALLELADRLDGAILPDRVELPVGHTGDERLWVVSRVDATVISSEELFESPPESRLGPPLSPSPEPEVIVEPAVASAAVPEESAVLRSPPDPKPSSGGPGPEEVDDAIEWLRDLALDYRDSLSGADDEARVEALAELFGFYFAKVASPERPPRELIAEINRQLGRKVHVRVPARLLRLALLELAGRAGAQAADGAVLVEVSTGGTVATWTLRLEGRTVETAVLKSGALPRPTPARRPPPLGSQGPEPTPRPEGVDASGWAPLPAAAVTVGTSLLETNRHTAERPDFHSPLTWSGSAGSAPASDPFSPMQPGDVVGKYRLVGLAGEGGMGQVWKAVPAEGIGGAVALKTFRRPERALREALERELRILRSLQRSDLFPLVHDAFDEGGRGFIVMDWVSGTDLEKHLSVASNLATVGRGQFLDWMSQVADRLSYLHAWQPRPIIFRDLKPSNVMLDGAGDRSLRLVDFGISHILDPAGADVVGRGTKGYVAPEVLQDRVDARADVFSMGRLALFLLFGHQRFRAIQRGSVPPNGKSRGLGSGVVDAALALAHEDANRRPSSVLEAFDGLRDACAESGEGRARRSAGPSCAVCAGPFLRDWAICPRCGDPRGQTQTDSTRGAGRPKVADTVASTKLEPSRPQTWRSLHAYRRLLELRASADLSELRCLGHIAVDPYDYQREAAVQVLRTMNGRALIADDVGLGKTIEAGLIVKEYLVRGLARRCLVVCPPNLLLKQLQEEFSSKFRLPFVEYRTRGDGDGDPSTVGPQGLGEADLVIVSSYTFRKEETADIFGRTRWDIAVLDECHHIRNHRKKLGRSIRSVTSQSDYRLFLSATPFSGKVDELWSVYNALEPGVLGASMKEFHRRFCVKRGRRWEPVAKKVREVTRSLTIRRRRADLHIQFPGRTARRLPVSLGRFRPLHDRFSAAVCEYTNSALVRHQLLQQFCSSFESVKASTVFPRLPWDVRSALADLHDEDHPKVRRLVEDLLPRLPPEEQVLVFSRYKASQHALERILKAKGLRARALRSGKKSAIVDSFRRGEFQVLIVGEGAGEGLNLQFCGVMINFDLPWNPMRIEQRIGRIQRLGQRRREVLVINLTVANSVEDRVLELLEEKLEIFRNLQGETEQILGELLGRDRSLEAWLAELLLPDGTIDPDRFAQKASEISEARDKVSADLRSSGEAADRLLGHGLVGAEGEQREPAAPLEEVDLGFVDELLDLLG